MNTPAILVVDDDESIREYLSYFLSSRGYAVQCLDSGDRALARLAEGFSPAAILLDLMLPGVSGLDILPHIKRLNPSVSVIVISAIEQVKTVVQAMNLGACNYVLKPFDEGELIVALEGAVEERNGTEGKALRRSAASGPCSAELVTSNPKMLRIQEIACQIADTDVPVLLLGESGVGKEVLARFIHRRSKRHEKAFVKVNCAALPNDLLESELFGYERGAFTGAMQDKPGKFELADKGTILLDEIGEMSAHLQAKLLHVLQDGEFTRLGGKRPIRVDARVLASTNRRLEDEVAKKQFREDLFYRLNVISIETPPLRDRSEDIPLLCEYFLEKYRDKYGSRCQQLPRSIMDTFQRYDWPGNIRELENAIKRYLILPDETVLLRRQEQAPLMRKPQDLDDVSLKTIGARAAEQAESELILRALRDTNWNRKQAARQLGICYKALLNKLKRWRLEQRYSEGVSGDLLNGPTDVTQFRLPTPPSN